MTRCAPSSEWQAEQLQSWPAQDTVTSGKSSLTSTFSGNFLEALIYETGFCWLLCRKEWIAVLVLRGMGSQKDISLVLSCSIVLRVS